jgi:hypothetical protein
MLLDCMVGFVKNVNIVEFCVSYRLIAEYFYTQVTLFEESGRLKSLVIEIYIMIV